MICYENISNFIVEKDSEIEIGDYRGSGGDLFRGFEFFSRGQNGGFPYNFNLFLL